MAELQLKMQKLSDDYQSIQKELQAAIGARQKLDAQKQENIGVQKEFQNLKEGEKIYKLVGPVLMEQQKVEAEATVKGRLDFITKEMERTDKQIDDLQAGMEKKKTEIMALQTSAQAASVAKA